MNYVKTEFDFGSEKWKAAPKYAELALKYQKGTILDIGCNTGELYRYLRSKGWNKKYYGMDIRKYDDFGHSKDINLIIGDALKVKFPKAETVILYNILEHVDKPLTLLRKALKSAKQNVLITIPKRNEKLWEYGVVESHQLDKTHKHCGFIKNEINELVEKSKGRIESYKEIMGISIIPLKFFRWKTILIAPSLNIPFTRKIYYALWCEITKR